MGGGGGGPVINYREVGALQNGIFFFATSHDKMGNLRVQTPPPLVLS